MNPELHPNLDRRRFLQLSVMAAASSLAASKSLAAGSKNADVIVIGAGMAGVSAASALVAAGVKNVIVLEGNNRIGGRIYTSRKVPGMVADLGAQWLTHAEVSPLVEFAKQQGIDIAKCNIDSNTYYKINYARYNAVDKAELFAQFGNLMGDAFGIREAIVAQGLPDISVKEAVELVYAANPPTDEARLVDRNLIRFFIETGTDDDYSKISFDNFSETLSEFLLGDFLIPQGYDQFVKALATGLDIRFKHIVQAVDYDRNQVQVHTNKGTFRASKVVITLPHAVLKRGDVTFTPELPLIKREAIHKISTGMTDKYWFKFPKVFWIKPNEKNPDFIGRISPRPIQWPSWYNMSKYLKTGQEPNQKPNPVLVGFNTSTIARKLADMSDDEVIKSAMVVLQNLYGHGKKIPEPIGMDRSSWGTNPFSGYGCVSYLSPGAQPGDRSNLRRSVLDVLFFAGEATSTDFPTLVLGAFQTGQIAAREIAASLVS